MNQKLAAGDGRLLLASHGSLARGVSSSAPGAVFALSLLGGITLGPKEGRAIVFGRNRPEVHVCLGEDDPQVSRHQGSLTHNRGQWWVSNAGRLPIRLAGSRLLFGNEDPVPLDAGYTPLFVRGSGNREHLLEVFVAGPDGHTPQACHSAETRPPEVWLLTDEEKLALVALGQRYLLHEPQPQPWTWKETAKLLAVVQPGVGWGSRRVENLVNDVRVRLSRGGVRGLTREEVGEPVGNSLNHNLLRALMLSTTLVPRDLDLIDTPDEWV